MNYRFQLQLVSMACAAVMACPAWATNYFDVVSGGNWNESTTWTSTPSGGTYPQLSGDTAVIDSGTVVVPNACASFPAIQSVEVTGSGSVLQFGSSDPGITWTVLCPVTMRNGSTIYSRAWHTVNLDGGLTVTGTNTFDIGYENYVHVRTNPITNTAPGAKLILMKHDLYAFNFELEVASPDYSGTWEVNATIRLDIEADGAINSNATVIVNSGGALVIGAAQTGANFGAGPMITAKTGGVVRSEIITDTGWKIRLEGGSFGPKDAGMMLNHSGVIELAGGSGRLETWQESALQVSGQITEAEPGMKLILAPRGGYYCEIYLSHTNNLHTGGTDIVGPGPGDAPGYTYVQMKEPGASGTGPIRIVPNTNDNNNVNELRLVKTDVPADWTLINDIGGAGPIKVEDGSYKLTVRGGAIGPGINTGVVSTNTAGTLTIRGSLAFTNNGAQYAQLNMEIAGTNNVAGIDYDRLTVSNNVSGLNYANLVVGIATNLTPADVAGKGFTIVTCTNDLTTGANFKSVAWSEGWVGMVVYGNGYVALTNLMIPKGTVFVIR